MKLRPTRPSSGRGFVDEIWAPRGREMIRVAAEALDLVQAERDYVRLHAGGTTFLVRMALRDFQGRLDPGRFLRVHRSTLVAADRIVAFGASLGGGWTVSLSTGHRLRVGRSFRSLVSGATAGAASDRRGTPRPGGDVP